MNIVFLSGEYPLWSPGGVGTFLQTFGRTLVAHGHSVSVVGPGVTHTEEILEDEGVRLYRLPRKNGLLPAFVHNSIQINRKLKELQKENPIDIIESAELGLAFITKAHPARKLIRLHGGHHFFAEAEKRGIHWRKGWLERRSFAKADAFIAISYYVKNHTEKYLSYHNKPIEVIPSPVDTDKPVPEVSKDQNLLLFAGTLCEKKGVRQLLQAFKIAREQYPEMHLELYGRLDWKYPSGELYIDRLKNDLDSSFFENVHFRGTITRDELFKKYARSLFCVFPSHMETQGLVTLEAMVLKKPVIFSEYGPGPETIEHGKTGLLCDVYDPEDIADKMIWYIEHPSEAENIGELASTAVRKKYEKEKILTENLEFYSRLLK